MSEAAGQQQGQFEVVSDGGLDRFQELHNAVPVAPFSIVFGSEAKSAGDFERGSFFRQLEAGSPHPTTAQPTPQAYAELYRAAHKPVLNVTISAGLSGSSNAAEQARALVPGAQVTLHDSRTLSAAQAFQVHAAESARIAGHDVATAQAWMRQVSDETELYFTIDTLEYLRRGGRIGRVQATLGSLLNLKPVVTVDKATGAYTNVGRARSYKAAIGAVAAQVTARYGAGTPLRLGLLMGRDEAPARELLAQIQARHPVVWAGFSPVNLVLAVHTGPSAVGVAAAPGPWPWER
jgi:DegV family protein with EDD domain